MNLDSILSYLVKFLSNLNTWAWADQLWILMTTWWFTRFWSVACDQCVPCPVVLSVSRYSRGGVSISWGSARCRGEVTQYYGKCYRLSPDDRKVISRQFQHKYPKLYFHNIAPNCECEDPYFIYCVSLQQEDFERSLQNNCSLNASEL